MKTAQMAFETCGENIQGTEKSQMFGKPCFKISGKAFVCFFQDCMVFKLTGDPHRGSLALQSAILFDPSGKGRAMKEWIQIPFEHVAQWPVLADAALNYVRPK